MKCKVVITRNVNFLKFDLIPSYEYVKIGKKG